MSYRKKTYKPVKRQYRSQTTAYSWQCRPRPPFIAIVAEKPKAAEKIAYALGSGVKCRFKGIPYWIIQHNGRRLYVVPSAGHLFGPHTMKRGFPVYDFEWKPIFEFDKGAAHLRKFYELMQYILPNASLYINACDYDIEGSVIGYTIIYYLGDIRKYKRMKFSSLSPTELRRAFYNLDKPDVNLVEAGMARHEIDWIWGINVSRALMHAARKSSGKRIILSAGRVQTPTMIEAVRRWKEINLAVPLPEFSIVVECKHGGIIFKAYPYGWKPETKKEAQEIVAQLRRNPKLKVVNVEKVKNIVRPPPAFNLGDLQREAARLYKFNPMKTQKLAEDLYLEALISYPRTNSQKLPPTINYKNIIQKLTLSPLHGQLASRLLSTVRLLKPVQGRKEDPAHPAIHPTGLLPKKLDEDHRKIYDLIVRRFLATFSSEAILARTTVLLEDNKNREYVSKGVTIIDEGWFYYYPYLKPKEDELPNMTRGDIVSISKASMKTIWARKTPDLSRTALLKWMESVNIGTEATRARIIEVLFRRGYLESSGGKTKVTSLGETVASIIEALFPELSKPDLTRTLERKLELVREGRATRREIVEETIRVLDSLLEKYNENLDDVGYRISLALGVGSSPHTCIICGRPIISREEKLLCERHFEAYRRLKSHLPIIAYRLGISEEEAVKTIAKLRGRAGKWVIEVASYWSKLRESETGKV